MCINIEPFHSFRKGSASIHMVSYYVCVIVDMIILRY